MRETFSTLHAYISYIVPRFVNAGKLCSFTYSKMLLLVMVLVLPFLFLPRSKFNLPENVVMLLKAIIWSIYSRSNFETDGHLRRGPFPYNV